MLLFNATISLAHSYAVTHLLQTLYFVFRSAHIHQCYEREAVCTNAECIQHMQACCLCCRHWMWRISTLYWWVVHRQLKIWLIHHLCFKCMLINVRIHCHHVLSEFFINEIQHSTQYYIKHSKRVLKFVPDCFGHSRLPSGWQTVLSTMCRLFLWRWPGLAETCTDKF